MDARALELDIPARDVVALHDVGRVVVPLGTEHGEADRGKTELVAETLDAEAVASVVQLFQLVHVEELVLVVAQDKDA